MTADLEQNVVPLEAPAAPFLASVSEPGAIRVLLMEEGVRASLTDELSKQGFAVRTVASLPAAACDADVIVLHCGRVNNSSIELLGKLHRLGFNTPVVLLTGELPPAHECLALHKGAIDVILKSLRADV